MITIEVEEVIIGTSCCLRFIDSVHIRMQCYIVLNTEGQAARWTACVLLKPGLETRTVKNKVVRNNKKNLEHVMRNLLVEEMGAGKFTSRFHFFPTNGTIVRILSEILSCG